MPDDPKDSTPYMFQTENATCLALLYPINEKDSLLRNKTSLITGIRRYLSDDQGLIQVETETDYVYSIVKSLKEGSGVQYILTFQRFLPDFVLNVQAFFEEAGTTGIRESVVYELCCRNGLVGTDDDPLAGWAYDPYDEGISMGALMNLSESEQFDALFPGFPLTLCREFVHALIGEREIG